MRPDWLALAVFAQPHGVSGRIKVKSLSDGPDDFAYASPLTDERGVPVKLKLTGHAQGMAVVEVEGVTRREQAELLRGRKIGTTRNTLPELVHPNRYYIHDLIGLAVFTAAGTAFGRVSDVVNYGAGDIVEIETHDGTRTLYAFTHATFPTIDIAAGRLTFVPPEVLMGDNGE